MKTQKSIDRFYEWMYDVNNKSDFPFFEDLPKVAMPIITPEEECIQEGINEEGYEEAMRNINDKS